MPAGHVTPKELVGAVGHLNCGMFGRDSEGRLLFVNRRILDWLGYTNDELVGQPMEIFAPPELDGEIHYEMRARNAGDQRARLTVFQRKDRTTIPVLLIPSQDIEDEDGNAVYYAVVIELAAVQTAKPAGYGNGEGLRGEIERIALQLQVLGLSAASASSGAIPFDHPDLKSLSKRESEVLAHLMTGERVPSIAKTLHISPHTVRNHLKSIFRQLGVHSQASLIESVRALGRGPAPR
jgi:PAS domain S-box-containing protein